MNYIEVLRENLKSNFFTDLFETYDVEVRYIYDRTKEGMDDEYWAEIPDMGLEFVFDEEQNLATLFMASVSHSGFNPFSGLDPRDVPFDSGVTAMEYARENSIEAIHQEAKTDSYFGEVPEWVKFNFESFSIHYKFHDNRIDRVTLQVENA
ncbi:MAG: hypothetical protein GY931_18800 [Maribacter sp.]|nr:hypothetical protein [Maribacter sp.]